LVWSVKDLAAEDLRGGVRYLYYVLVDEGGDEVEMSVTLRGYKPMSVLVTRGRDEFVFSRDDAEEFLRFVEIVLLKTKLPNSPLREEEVDPP
jgi:hypothetical protein